MFFFIYLTYYIKIGHWPVCSALVFYSKHSLRFCLMITVCTRGCGRASDALGKHEERKQVLVNEDASLIHSLKAELCVSPGLLITFGHLFMSQILTGLMGVIKAVFKLQAFIEVFLLSECNREIH